MGFIDSMENSIGESATSENAITETCMDSSKACMCFETYVLMKKTRKVLEDGLSTFRKMHDLKSIELNILYFISWMHKLSQDKEWIVTSSDICKTLQLNKGQVSIALDALTKKGYLETKESEKDKRVTFYRLNDKSKKITNVLDDSLEKVNEKIKAKVTEDEVAAFKKVFDCYIDSLNELLS